MGHFVEDFRYFFKKHAAYVIEKHMSTDAHIPTITAYSIPVLCPSAVHNIKSSSQYLLQ